MESNFDPQAISPKGAQGLMQLMPQTARELQVSDPFSPRDNIVGGARYLRYLLDLFNQDLSLALAAYNAGPEKVNLYHGVPPYLETRTYVQKVLQIYNRLKTNSCRRDKLRFFDDSGQTPHFEYLQLPYLLRIISIPFVLFPLQSEKPNSNLLAAVIFGSAFATDWLDGLIARRKNLVTQFGKILDPLADKLLIGCSLIMLIGMDRVEAWIGVLIIGREIAVTWLRAMLAAEGHILSSSWWGKYKTFFRPWLESL